MVHAPLPLLGRDPFDDVVIIISETPFGSGSRAHKNSSPPLRSHTNVGVGQVRISSWSMSLPAAASLRFFFRQGEKSQTEAGD